MIINNNLMAMNAQRQLSTTGKCKKKSTEKLSSGYKVNRAADDAAGLSISEKMRNQIRGLNQSMKNIEDGISFLNTADGALEETHRILDRIGELAVRAANDTNASEDREALNNEVQELKKELDHTFKTTAFNGKKIWTVSYSPMVSGMPNDIQMYNDPSHPSGFGGVLINEKRYSWSEIGVQFLDDGKTFSGGKYEVKDVSGKGEKIVLLADRGKMPPDISRQYEWSTDGNNMYINGIKAASFSEMGVEEKAETDKRYEFDFHGMHIEFEIPAGHDLEDIVNGINGDNFMSKATWKSETTLWSGWTTVDYMQNGNSQYIKDSWKNNLKGGSEPYFKFQADEFGLTLIDSAGHSYTTKSWKDFGIEDWGVYNEISTGTPVDPDKIYNYTDSITGFSVNFKINYVAGKGDVISALEQSIVSSHVYAPVRTTVTPSSDGLEVTCLTSMSTNLLIDSQISFSNWDSDFFSTDLNIGFDDDGNYTLTYDVKNKSGNVVGSASGKISPNARIGVGGSLNVYLTGDDGLELTLSLKNTLNTVRNGTSIINDLRTKSFQTKLNGMPQMINGMADLGNSWGEPYAGGVTVNAPYKEVYIQSGANSGEHHFLDWKSLSVAAIGMGGASVASRDAAVGTIISTQNAIKIISAERSNFGAHTNRLSSTLNSNALYSENLQKAESSIRDADIAEEMTELARHNILEQMGISMLTQANQSNQGVLNLLQ